MTRELRRGAGISLAVHIALALLLVLGIPHPPAAGCAGGDLGGDGVPGHLAGLDARRRAGPGAGASGDAHAGAAAPPAQEPPKPQPNEAPPPPPPPTATAAAAAGDRHPADPDAAVAGAAAGALAHAGAVRPGAADPTCAAAADAAAADAAVAVAAAARAATTGAAEHDVAAEPDQEPGAAKQCAGEHAGTSCAACRSRPSRRRRARQPACGRRAERRRQSAGQRHRGAERPINAARSAITSAVLDHRPRHARPRQDAGAADRHHRRHRRRRRAGGTGGQGRVGGNPRLRVFSERAVRAVMDPHCANLPLPRNMLGDQRAHLPFQPVTSPRAAAAVCRCRRFSRGLLDVREASPFPDRPCEGLSRAASARPLTAAARCSRGQAPPPGAGCSCPTGGAAGSAACWRARRPGRRSRAPAGGAPPGRRAPDRGDRRQPRAHRPDPDRHPDLAGPTARRRSSARHRPRDPQRPGATAACSARSTRPPSSRRTASAAAARRRTSRTGRSSARRRWSPAGWRPGRRQRARRVPPVGRAAGAADPGHRLHHARAANWRRIAHIISDVIYERLLGEKGYFDTRDRLCRRHRAARPPRPSASRSWTRTARTTAS